MNTLNKSVFLGEKVKYARDKQNKQNTSLLSKLLLLNSVVDTF